MGNLLSGASAENAATSSNIRDMDSESETIEDVSCLRDGNEVVTEEHFYDTVSDDEETRAKLKEEEMSEFRKQLSVKREQRREILARHRKEKKELENALHNEMKSKMELCESNRLLRELLLKKNIEIPEDLQCDQQPSYIADSISHMAEEIEKLKSTNIALRCELAKTNNTLQATYSDMAELSAQNSASIKQVNALKEVITVSKTMIGLREQQLNELKSKLNEIEQSLADRETSMLSTDLRQEYERQLQNIRTLRGLYEERARLADVSRQALSRELDEHKVLLEAEINKTNDLTAKVNDLEAKVNVLEETVEDKNNLIASCQRETRGIKAEMSVVNKLFSQVLLGYKNKQDLDMLVHRLEENHGILTQMAGKENSAEVSSELPKLLLELVSQIDEPNTSNETAMSDSVDGPGVQNTSAEEIVENLPKVWRVLIELLSHQSETDSKTTDKVTTCYKSVETKSGPVLVPSVSQTYIRLKDLILEKLTLIKEVNRMKQLNTHLESRLEEQERRLCLVTNELSKTWNVVGRLRRHHHQLHTHEKILKYELQQKRKLLNELKEELEYCREKWEQAREKNTQSEKDWKKLRAEFSNRKLKPDLALINNSAESGYSDEKPSDESSESNDESAYVELKMKCKKKLKKSFETNADSSGDFNLAAEREDPASDMLDVADLPLDTQEDIHECDDVSDSFNSESLFKNEKLCEETEDETADITNEDHSIAERSPDCSIKEDIVSNETHNGSDVPGTSTSSNNLLMSMTIDPAAILKSIREQNERLALRDKRLEKLENNGSSLLKKTQTIAKFSDQINSSLDSILNRPSSGRQCDDEKKTSEVVLDNIITTENIQFKNSTEDIPNTEEHFEHSNVLDNPSENSNQPNHEDEITTNIASTSLQEIDTITDAQNLNFSEILENVRKQNERLELKDKRLEKLEQGCTEVVKHISNTLNSGSATIAKLDDLHERFNKKETSTLQEPDHNENLNLVPESNSITSAEEPSTSRDIDHEARFAARDLRLRRLEEQTKSLVKKVNKTTTKGVKINYKLEELHNIYGSENSRSGTPSEDTEDNSQNDDDVPNE
ncbi:putative leucine-rich repeat-containing protein DDB_G0290503 [Maniola hyperantus]|uniref:putative leucine-rich repeat-containing protein DDB_G0290503 n=1 Tax=Aphantopus hyperantus TaxID=2795564 RepID=UPI0015698556|nr:putative leucine-rich repeat-containing protein DDB_G0290503 [Maniola hyperantus]